MRPSIQAAALAAAALVGLAGATVIARSSPADTAAVFRGDIAHTGVYHAPALERFGGMAWRFQTGGPVQSTPAVADGVLYVGSGDGYLYALDARTGGLRRRWSPGGCSSAAGMACITRSMHAPARSAGA